MEKCNNVNQFDDLDWLTLMGNIATISRYV